MTDFVAQELAAGDYDGLAFGLLVGLAGALFVAMLWLRLLRWAFGLFGFGA